MNSMCCTSAPAILSDTILYAGEAIRNGVLVHVLAYQNSAKNLSRKPNAMILPIPSRAPMGPENMIDTTSFKSFLLDMQEAITPRSRGFSSNGGDDDLDEEYGSAVQVFERGSYTVILADNANDVPAALQRVAPERRPEISTELLQAYAKFYPTWPIAVCCFEAATAPEPLLWWYEPRDGEYLWAPALDSHDGTVPRVGEMVNVDHTVIFGSNIQKVSDAARVYFTDHGANSQEAFHSLLASEVTGVFHRSKQMRNGDFRIHRQKLSAAHRAERVAPPGFEG